MKSKKFILLGACAVLAASAIAVASLSGSNSFMRGIADESKTLTITAEHFKAAMDQSKTTFDYGGVTWSFAGATYNDGKITIDGGMFQNTTHAGAYEEDGKVGTGFKTVRVNKTDAKSGFSIDAYDSSNNMLGSTGMGASTSEADSYLDFASKSYGKAVTRMYLAFGAAGGTTFTSIVFTYGCEAVGPSLTLSGPSSIALGETGTKITGAFSHVEGTPAINYVSSDPTVLTVAADGSITTVGAGTSEVSATFTYLDQPYTSKNTLSITVFEAGYNVIDYSRGLSLVHGPSVDPVSLGQFGVWHAGDSATTASYNNKVITIEHKKGAEFWSTQAFYKEPYFDYTSVHQFYFTMDVNLSTGTANLEVNGINFALTAGDNHLSAQITASAARTMEIMWGTRSPSTSNDTATYVISNFKLFDLTANNRHQVTFTQEDGLTVFDTAVALDGKVVRADIGTPVSSDPTKSFISWKDSGDNDVDLSTWAVTADATLTPYFAVAAKHTVTFMNGLDKIEDVEVVEGAKVTKPSYGYDVLGFGYVANKFYLESTFDTEYDFTDTVTGDLTLYARPDVTPSMYYGVNNSDTFVIGPTFVADDINGGSGDIWNCQINFGSVPNISGHTMTLTFDYRINHAGGKVNLYNAGDWRQDLTVDDAFQTITFQWDSTKYGSATVLDKLSFELGGAGVGPSSGVKLELKNFTFTTAVI